MDFVLFFYQLIRAKRTFATAVMSLPVRQLKLKFNYIYKFYIQSKKITKYTKEIHSKFTICLK